MSGQKKPPRVESLESRAVPSTVPFLPTGVSGMLGAHAQGNPAPVLSGLLTGKYTPAPHHTPDAGVAYNLQGVGTLKGLGQVTLTGSLHPTGFVKAGHAIGTIVLANAHGTLTLHLEGTLQAGFSPLPTHFYFNVVKGTGSFAHVLASGTVEFHQAPEAVPLHLLPGGTPPEAGGTFAMSLQQITL
jgi:hypothetical protein